ncbi:MAG: glycosyltransferase family 4 protein, partial [Cytophagales bacterium]
MKKKLAIVTTHPIQYYAPLFRELARSESIEIKVFYTKGEPEIVQFEPDFGTSIAWDIPLLEGYDFQFLENVGKKSVGFWSISNPRLIAEIENWDANSILVFGWSYQSHLNVMRHFKGKIPVLFRGDSTLLDEKWGLKTAIRRIFLKLIYRFVDKALYVGIENKKYFIKHGLRENQLVFAPHAIDNERFYDFDGEYARKAASWRLELGIFADDIVVLFVGKFYDKKNPKVLIGAFRSLNLLKVHLIFVGNGPLENQIKSESNSDSKIHFIDFQNQSKMPIVYKIGDIFCISSHSETWGLAVNEAMASGCAVLVSNKCGCASNLVENGQNGFVFEYNNERQLSMYISQ